MYLRSVLLVVSALLVAIDGFVVTPSSRHVTEMMAPLSPLFAEDEAAASAEESATEGGEETPPAAEEEAPAEPAEDPEIVALKEEIASVEAVLKAKKGEVDRIANEAERYSQTGYARRVAEMEESRKRNKLRASSSASTATADVVQNFLPVLDDLRELKSVYGEDAFGKSYTSLAGVMTTALQDLGFAEFEVPVGSTMDRQKAVAVEEEYSEETAKGAVIRMVKTGMELEGNVMRMAEVVVSLGKEGEEEQEQEEGGDAAESEEAAESE